MQVAHLRLEDDGMTIFLVYSIKFHVSVSYDDTKCLQNLP